MSLKIIFFIFAALAGFALIGSLSPEGKKQTTTAATEIENRAFLNAPLYVNVLGRLWWLVNNFPLRKAPFATSNMTMSCIRF